MWSAARIDIDPIPGSQIYENIAGEERRKTVKRVENDNFVRCDECA